MKSPDIPGRFRLAFLSVPRITFPSVGDRRVMLAFRILPAGLAKVDRLAAEAGKSRSAMLRLLVSEAVEARLSAAATTVPGHGEAVQLASAAAPVDQGSG